MKDKVNIGMVTYNRLELTKKAIDSITMYTDYPYTLTVVDNNSTDGTQEYLKSLYRNTVHNLVLLDKNIGVAKASNIAWQMEDCDYYMKFDNDIVVITLNWLTKMVNVLKEIKQAGTVGCGLTVDTHHGTMPQVSKEIKTLFTKHAVTFPQWNRVNGGLILIPKRTHKKLGFWCENYGLYSEEDVDYALRVIRSNMFCLNMGDPIFAIHLQQAVNYKEDSKYLKHKIECMQTSILHKDYKENHYISASITKDKFKDKIYKDGK